MDVDVLLFDVGGTVFDWRTAIVEALTGTQAAEIRALDAEAFSAAWREQSLIEMYEIAERKVPWRAFDAFLNTSLDTVLGRFGVERVGEEDRATLCSAWGRMPVWPGVPEALARLRRRYFVAPHTILGLAPAAFSSKAAGLSWDAIISCDGLGATKTDPQSYARALTTVGRSGSRVCYVAAHPIDLRAAREHGMHTAYVVARLEDYGDDYEDTGFEKEFDVVAEDFTDLAGRLT